ncbi:MAG: endolytic transglycosylase MltG [Dehalococcoidia bacterium]|nr:endolytic transglycosylase MltG [Dehalococcoidia bacterium]
MKTISACLVRLSLMMAILVVVGVFSAILLLPGRIEELGQHAVDYFDKPASAVNSQVLFRINPGENAATIGERLEAQGLIRSADVFRVIVTYYRISGSLEAGEYELRPDMTVTEIITVIHKGLIKTTLITIPEGWRTAQIAESLGKQGIFGKEELLKAAKDGNYGYDFLQSGSSGAYLEGYLFPDTYRIPPSISPSDLVNYLLKNFDQRVTPAMRNKVAASGLTLHETVTLASIVERESAATSERPLIASVFLNRLELGMPLQADATVQYAIANDPASVARFGFWKVGLTQADLDVVSPYNTYRNRGLPPGPICNPGLESIQAVIQPADSNFLYFVAAGDGSHAFAKTLSEHERNIRLYQR